MPLPSFLPSFLFFYLPPTDFGYLHRALLTLFRVSTFEDWTDVMYINVYGCSRWGYNDDDTVPFSKQCNKTEFHEGVPNWLYALYFIAFIIFGSLVLLTLFVGVVTTSMEEAQSAWVSVRHRRVYCLVLQLSHVDLRSLRIDLTCSSPQKNVDAGEKKIATYMTAKGVDPTDITMDISLCFDLVDADGGGEISNKEFRAALDAINDLPDGEFNNLKGLDFRKLVPEDVPEEGNPFVFMIWVMTMMASAAGSDHRFPYDMLEKLEEEKAKEEERARKAAEEEAEGTKKRKSVKKSNSRSNGLGSPESSI